MCKLRWNGIKSPNHSYCYYFYYYYYFFCVGYINSLRRLLDRDALSVLSLTGEPSKARRESGHYTTQRYLFFFWRKWRRTTTAFYCQMSATTTIRQRERLIDPETCFCYCFCFAEQLSIEIWRSIHVDLSEVSVQKIGDLGDWVEKKRHNRGRFWIRREHAVW
jgi:hypothetical protein